MSIELRAKIIHAIQAPGSFSDWAERAADRILALLTPPSELRAKIKSILQTELSTCDSLYDDIADRILAMLPPPATAKLPEGVVVCAMPDGRYHVRGCGWWLLKQGRWEKMTLPTHEYPGEFVSHDEALTAALSAPPVPGESSDPRPPLAPDDWKGRYERALEGTHSKIQRIVHLEGDVKRQAARIAELEAENEELKESLDGANSLLENHVCTPAEKPDPLARAVTVGEMLRLAEDVERRGWPNVALAIRIVFTPPQGAPHAE